jgi:hypothetical protein
MSGNIHRVQHHIRQLHHQEGGNMVRACSRLTSIVALLVLLSAMPAAGFLVTNLNDAGPGSLRQAVIDANTAVGSDVVTFQPGLFGTIHLTSGEVAITDSVDVQGPGARTLAVDSTARIFNISGGNSVNVTISGLTLTGAHATSNGGAIANTGANVTLRFDTLSGNNTTGEGGAIFHNANGGIFTIDSCTLSGNTAGKAGAVYSIGYNLVIINSTISGNHATDSVGGVKLEFAYASIYNSTIAGNTAAFSQGGILAGTGNNQLDLTSTIVANNADIAGASDLVRFAGFVNSTNSLIEQNLAAGVINGTDTGNLVGVDPMLGPLAPNGGPTNTHAISTGGPAIDAGANPLALASDQRGPGYLRQVGGAADIGAFEFGAGTNIPVLSRLGALVFGLVLLASGLLALRWRAA